LRARCSPFLFVGLSLLDGLSRIMAWPSSQGQDNLEGLPTHEFGGAPAYVATPEMSEAGSSSQLVLMQGGGSETRSLGGTRSALSMSVSGERRPSNSNRGVRFGEVCTTPVGQADGTPTAPRTRAMSSEQLVTELELYCPPVAGYQVKQVEEVLQQVCALAREAASSVRNSQPTQETGELLPVGAYHLGVMLPTDTVDVVYVASDEISMTHLLPAVRDRFSRHGGITDLAPASVNGLFAAPGVQFKMHGVSVKLLLSQRLQGLPDPSGDAMVPNMAGIHARQISDEILERVPNLPQFRLLLRFVRIWARQRGVFGSFLGFFGGTAWALCCARICQMHPNLDPSQLTAKFFRTMSRWDWKMPLTLLVAGARGLPFEVSPAAAAGTESATSTAWPDNGHVIANGSGNTMSVILPIGRHVTATPHLTETTSAILQKEFRRGYKIAHLVEIERARWCDVYAGARFFQHHRHYLEFDFMATSESILLEWLAWGQQQLQSLVQIFETSNAVVTVRPWPVWMEYRDADWPYSRAIFVGLHLERSAEGRPEANGGSAGAIVQPQESSQQRRSLDLREPIVKFLEAIGVWSEAQRHANQFELLIRHLRLSELRQWLDCQQRGDIVERGESEGTRVGETNWQNNGAFESNGASWAIEVGADGMQANTTGVDGMQCSL